MNRNMKKKTIEKINLNDNFFDSLREDYYGFDRWLMRKKEKDAYVQYDDDGNIEGFLFLQLESEIVNDVQPPIIANKIQKVSTFKIDAHGTRLGERFIKIIMDNAINENVDLCYVTIFPKHETLIKLMEEFGFIKYGVKGNKSNLESVYIKNMKYVTGNINIDYPIINAHNVRKFILSIYPKYHTVMFPDSILTTENKNILTDVSYTNSIYKIYVSSIRDTQNLRYGDIVVVYRTGASGRAAEYSAVATSICVVQEVKDQSEFLDFDQFYKYASRYSVFDRDDLYKWFQIGGCKAIKLTYNIALKKRIVRHDLIEKIGLSRNKYWGFFELNDKEFSSIVNLGNINEELIRN